MLIVQRQGRRLLFFGKSPAHKGGEVTDGDGSRRGADSVRQEKSQLDLGRDEALPAVFFAELRLLNLARGIARHLREDEFARTLVARQVVAEFDEVFLGRLAVRLEFDDRGGDFAQARVGESDDGDVLNVVVTAQEVFDLDGVQVLAPRDDDVLLAVDEEDEPVFVLARHVAREEPAVGERRLGRFRVVIVFLHDSGSEDGEFADFALLNRLMILVDDLRLPAVAWLADRADLVNVFDAQMDAARSDRLAQPVVRVVFMEREIRLPAFDEARRHRLGADVHETPLREDVVAEIDLFRFDRVEDILRPRNEEPDDRATFFRDRMKDRFGLDSAQQHGLAADEETAEPVHLRAGVIERRDAEEDVLARLRMVVLLREAGRGQAAVRVQDRLREARRSGGEVDRGVVFARELDVGRLVGGVHREAMERFREGGTVFADEEERFDIGQLVADRLDSSDEFGPEDEIARIGEPEAVFDFVRGVAEVQRHGDRARLENPEVDREPFEAVHEQNRDLVSLLDPAAQEQIREAVGELVELLPRRGAAQSDRMARRLDEIEVFPRDAARRVLRLGREFDEADVGTVKERVSLENFGDGGQFGNRRKFALHYTRLRKSRPSRAAKIGNRLNRKNNGSFRRVAPKGPRHYTPFARRTQGASGRVNRRRVAT